MKKVTLILILSLALGLNAQDLIKSDFKKTEWFVDNENRNFYESDTILLTRILTLNSEVKKPNEIYIKLEKNHNGDITELNFKKSGKLIVKDLNVENWSVTKLVGKWKWKFDPEKQTLKLYFKRKLRLSFRVESIDKESIYWNESYIEFLVLYLVRIKN
jgi:hypothetical protein|tara:strand:+ start:25380 stop:25856 length:477 start_codon:yes stop_codon:yes gene_type:complete